MRSLSAPSFNSTCCDAHRLPTQQIDACPKLASTHAPNSGVKCNFAPKFIQSEQPSFLLHVDSDSTQSIPRVLCKWWIKTLLWPWLASFFTTHLHCDDLDSVFPPLINFLIKLRSRCFIYLWPFHLLSSIKLHRLLLSFSKKIPASTFASNGSKKARRGGLLQSTAGPPSSSLVINLLLFLLTRFCLIRPNRL